MAWTYPTPADFKAFFYRDFNFAQASDPNNLDYVTDTDLDRAILEGSINFNSDLFGSDAQVTVAFLYLAAFHLVRNLQNSARGISSQARFPINSTSVGGVSISFQIPDKYANDPYLSSFTQNGYGMRYLELILPWLVGNVGIADGATTWY